MVFRNDQLSRLVAHAQLKGSDPFNCPFNCDDPFFDSAALADAAGADVVDVLERIGLVGDISVLRWRDGDEGGARELFDRALAWVGGLSTHWMRARALGKLATAPITREGAALLRSRSRLPLTAGGRMGRVRPPENTCRRRPRS